MEELCAKSADDDQDLKEKISRFISDRSIDTVTGIRRMGRDNLVDFLVLMCSSEGFTASVFPDTSSDRIIVFRHWTGMDDEVKRILSEKPDVDILYGQDLCHQVPAVVRYRK